MPRPWRDPLPPSTTVHGAINGIAFASDGVLYVGKNRQVVAIDAATGATIGEPITNSMFLGYDGSGDLASCASPPSLTLKKNVESRADSDDQFELRLKEGTEDVGSATTSGTANGLQPQTVGPYVVRGGHEFHFEEVVHSPNNNDYDATWQCTAENYPTFSGTGKSGSITIPNNVSGLGAAYTCTFTNVPAAATGKAQAKKVDAADTDAVLQGAGFQLWRDVNNGALPTDPDAKVGEPKTSGTNGIAEWDELPEGDYLIQEISAPDGYAVSSPTLQKITVVKDQTATAVFQNPRVHGTITWSKVDADEDKVLSDSVWTLRGPDDLTKPVTVEDCESGPCSGPDEDPRPGHFKVTDLAWGDYELRESTAPTGYDPLSDPIVFQVTRSNVVNDSNEPTPIALGAQENTKKRGAISWQKTDDAQQLLGGSVWSLQTPDGQPIEVTDCTAEPCDGADQDPASGRFLVEDLAWGDYVLTEVTAPTGYQLDATEHEVRIDADNVDQPHDIGGIINQRILGTVVWSKTDAATPANPLAGSQWALTGPDGQVTEIADCVEDDAADCTGADTDPAAGSFKVVGLDWGDYELVETRAPAGYLLDESSHSFQIGSTNLNHVFDEPFINVQRDGMTIPLTGGTSAQMYLLAGGVGMALTVALAIWRRRKNALI